MVPLWNKIRFIFQIAKSIKDVEQEEFTVTVLPSVCPLVFPHWLGLWRKVLFRIWNIITEKFSGKIDILCGLN